MDISNQVKQIVSYHSGVKIKQLTETTLIEEELGTTGDDAWELIEDFSQKFGVDLSSFDFTLHFLPEVSSSKNKEYGYYPVSIGHLIDVANEKLWFLPPKNEDNYDKAKNLARKNQLMLFIIVTIISLAIMSWGYINACA